MDATPETLLLDAAQGAMRTPRGRVALVLRMSRLPSPAPRRYHRRIAHAILKDTAQRHGGEVFLLRNGDAVLLCRQAGPATPAEGAAVDPGGLPALMARLFQADLPAGTDLTTLWALERDGEALLGYATRMSDARGPLAANAA